MERILKINGKPKIFDISQTCAHFSAQQHSRLQKPTSKNWLLISWSHHLYIIEDIRWPLNLELNTDTNFLCHLILLCGKISRDIILSPLALALFCRSQVTSHHTSCPGFLAPKAVPFHLVPRRDNPRRVHGRCRGSDSATGGSSSIPAAAWCWLVSIVAVLGGVQRCPYCSGHWAASTAAPRGHILFRQTHYRSAFTNQPKSVLRSFPH